MHILHTQAHTHLFLESKKKSLFLKFRNLKPYMFLLCKTRKKAIHLNLSYVSRNHFLVFSLFSSSGFIQVLIGFWRRQWHPTPVLLPRKSHGRRGLVDCSPWGCWESGTTERLHFHFSLSCIGEGNGNPLQCSCLENPRDGGAWWAAVYGVAQSRTRLKRLSSSSSNRILVTDTFWCLMITYKTFALPI